MPLFFPARFCLPGVVDCKAYGLFNKPLFCLILPKGLKSPRNLYIINTFSIIFKLGTIKCFGIITALSVVEVTMTNKTFPACPVETTLRLVGNRWKVLIIRDLLEETKRFNELRRSVGNITQKVLTANLRDMEESGLLTRAVFAEVPPRVEYTLTELGRSLAPVLTALSEWGTCYQGILKDKGYEPLSEV